VNACTSTGAFVKEVAVLDGALLVSYPPRETFHAYRDCPDCFGTGQLQGEKWRLDSRRNRFTRSCASCRARFAEHPLRAWAMGRRAQLWRAAQNRYDSTLEKLAKEELKTRGEKRLKKAVAEEKLRLHNQDDPRVQELRTGLLNRVAVSFARLKRMEQARGVWDTRPPTEDESRLADLPTR
jgi:hypothetical protein